MRIYVSPYFARDQFQEPCWRKGHLGTKIGSPHTRGRNGLLPEGMRPLCKRLEDRNVRDNTGRHIPVTLPMVSGSPYPAMTSGDTGPCMLVVGLGILLSTLRRSPNFPVSLDHTSPISGLQFTHVFNSRDTSMPNFSTSCCPSGLGIWRWHWHWPGSPVGGHRETLRAERHWAGWGPPCQAPWSVCFHKQFNI